MTETAPILIEKTDDNSLLAQGLVPTERVAEVAAQLNGCEYGEEGSSELWACLKSEGIVVVFGASDDLIEFRGAIYDEAYGPTTVSLTPTGLLTPDADTYNRAEKAAFPTITALWCPEGEVLLSWAYETSIPHATFEVMEGHDLYCRGIVFALSAIAQAQQVTHD